LILIGRRIFTFFSLGGKVIIEFARLINGLGGETNERISELLNNVSGILDNGLS
jgi:hypothetical protein